MFSLGIPCRVFICLGILASDGMFHVTRIVNYLIISVKTNYIHGKIQTLWYFTGHVCIVWCHVFVFAESILFLIFCDRHVCLNAESTSLLAAVHVLANYSMKTEMSSTV